ncbi:hypothetical protein NUU61_000251 [Penicillium alfredii]|uniref:Pal1 cell morphology n=1 Tax=Penicillium alfredii TaxID=1506179 RepID=A0A9W9G9J3_9EURO|nr:uncharacterized protein NUU61_000251 [Penicillium alfredii]KAJ5114492.1 hypothetical protein NUU61_000251 [Penicillium alfredii]
MAAVECMPLASRHHPHHPFNQNRRPSVGSSMGSSIGTTIGSNNPYARYMSPSPSLHSRRSHSESMPSIYFSGSPEHHPVEPPRRRDSGVPLRRRSMQQKYSRHSQLVHPDIIDQLDNVTAFSYHHEGPYDAVCPERNLVSQSSPLEAVKESNAEALRATPRDKIVDCINSHRPLDGTAFFPPGTSDPSGQHYDYEEGSNMMNDFGNFMRMPGKRFTDDDFKNDPFYNRPVPNPFAQLRKVLSLRRRKRRSTT